MAFKPVNVQKKYFKFSECKPGDVLIEEGLYVGTEEGTFGEVHVFKEKDGTLKCLNSAGQLNYILKNQVESGRDICRVIYAGESVIEKGPMRGKKAHSFEVFKDDAVGEVSPESPLESALKL